MCCISCGLCKYLFSIRLGFSLNNSDILFKLWFVCLDSRSDFFCLLFHNFCFCLLFCNLTLNKTLLFRCRKLNINNLDICTVSIHVIKLFVNGLFQNLSSLLSLSPKHSTVKLTYLSTDGIINFGDKNTFVILLVIMIELPNIFLLEFVLNRKCQGDGLTNTILNIDRPRLCIWIMSEINVLLSWWENKEWLNWTDEVPPTWINFLCIYSFRDRVVNNSIFDWLNCSDTTNNDNKRQQQAAHTATNNA